MKAAILYCGCCAALLVSALLIRPLGKPEAMITAYGIMATTLLFIGYVWINGRKP